MKRIFTTATLVAALALIPSSAIAGPFLIDPIIGVRGIDVGSTASNDSTFVTMGGCQADLIAFFGAGNVFCESYFIVSPVSPTPTNYSTNSYVPPFSVTDVTLRFSDANGGILNQALFPDSYRSGYTPSGLNAFDIFTRSQTDPFAVTLALAQGAFSCGNNDPQSAFHTTCFQVYLAIPQNETVNGPYGVSLTAINGVQQDPTLAPVPVPEPGTLALLVTGLVCAGFRSWRRSGHP